MGVVTFRPRFCGPGVRVESPGGRQRIAWVQRWSRDGRSHARPSATNHATKTVFDLLDRHGVCIVKNTF